MVLTAVIRWTEMHKQPFRQDSPVANFDEHFIFEKGNDLLDGFLQLCFFKSVYLGFLDIRH
ncbi:hypothetical protein SDC9_113604 [bioreactor metagenome]|uniref:Uncharacterized protein n=1 Tax=bioreactor metagenome TaxID=1076179 RepID=A0A645BYB5_9ZZZZ